MQMKAQNVCFIFSLKEPENKSKIKKCNNYKEMMRQIWEN